MTWPWLLFPAHAGVIPVNGFPLVLSLPIPRPRGGDPIDYSWRILQDGYSPPTRG